MGALRRRGPTPGLAAVMVAPALTQGERAQTAAGTSCHPRCEQRLPGHRSRARSYAGQSGRLERYG